MKARIVIAAALCATSLSACAFAGRDSAPEVATTAEASPTSSTPPPPTATPLPKPRDLSADEAPQEDIDDGEFDADATTPITDEAASQASERAAAFVRAYGRTDLPQEQWWTGVSGYFSPQARTAYAAADVTNISPLRVEPNAAKLEQSSTAYRAQVAVPTSAGTYLISLVRSDTDWLVERATPPSTGS